MNRTEPALRASAQRYLDVLAALAPPASLLDVRYRTLDGQLARFFTDMHDRNRDRAIVRIGQHTDIYVGCAPRRRRSGRRGALAPTALVWVDCDTPDATSALRAFIPAPSMIVQTSSQRAHGYWALTRPLAVEQIEQLNRRLAAALGADGGAVTAATAILRVPGTLSFKRTPPQPVRLCRCAGRRYTPAELTAALPGLDGERDDAGAKGPVAPAAGGGYRQRLAGDPLLAIPPAKYVPALTGRQPGRDHKIHCPLHEDRTPSFHVYDTPEQGWTCFGCKTTNGKRLGGDIYTLASLLFGIPASGAGFFELRQRLDEIFGVARG